MKTKLNEKLEKFDITLNEVIEEAKDAIKEIAETEFENFEEDCGEDEKIIYSLKNGVSIKDTPYSMGYINGSYYDILEKFFEAINYNHDEYLRILNKNISIEDERKLIKEAFNEVKSSSPMFSLSDYYKANKGILEDLLR